MSHKKFHNNKLIFVHISRVTRSNDLVPPVLSHQTHEEADHIFTTPAHICLGCDHTRTCAYYIRNAKVALPNWLIFHDTIYVY